MPIKPKPSPVWRQALLWYHFDRDRFLEHYHQRSNAETVADMLKNNTLDYVRNRNDIAMANEVYCKVIVHNIWCTILSMYELGIVADVFRQPDQAQAAD